MKVTRSVSLDLEVLNKLYEECNKTGEDISKAINRILRNYFMLG